MKRGLRLVAALGVLVAVGSTSYPAPATASGIELVRFHGGHGGGGFHGGGFHGGGLRGGGFHGRGFRGGYGGRGFYRPGFGYGPGYGFHRRRAWCFYHPGACYPYP